MASQNQRTRAHRDLVTARRTDRKLEVIDLLSSGVYKKHQVFKGGWYSTQDAHDKLVERSYFTNPKILGIQSTVSGM